jgi:hypothetical protein
MILWILNSPPVENTHAQRFYLFIFCNSFNMDRYLWPLQFNDENAVGVEIHQIEFLISRV